MKVAPGPRGALFFGSLLAARRDPLKMVMDAVRDHGDVVRLTFGPAAAHLVRHPDQMKQVLQDPKLFSKRTRGFDNIRLLIANGLLTSEGDFWLRQRRIAQPAFHRERIAGFLSAMARARSSPAISSPIACCTCAKCASGRTRCSRCKWWWRRAV